MDVKAGDRVLFGKYTGTEIKIEEQTDGRKVCNYCQGSGQCFSCDGTGAHVYRRWLRTKRVACPVCEGSGRCGLCHGKG